MLLLVLGFPKSHLQFLSIIDLEAKNSIRCSFSYSILLPSFWKHVKVERYVSVDGGIDPYLF